MAQRRLYETTIIVNAALEDDDIEAIVRRVSDYIENHGGNIIDTNKWGRRRLAYPIKKKYNGYYVYFAYDITTEIVPLLERFFILDENVLRHLTVYLPQKLRDYRAERVAYAAARAAEAAQEAAKQAAESEAAAQNNKPAAPPSEISEAAEVQNVAHVDEPEAGDLTESETDATPAE